MKEKKPSVLVILDGWGYSKKHAGNAVYKAAPPYFTTWWHRYPHTVLKASGSAVGLPDHMMGNSAVGHLTIGAGHIVEQPVTYYLRTIADGSFFKNKDLIKHFKQLAKTGKALHIIGVLSDGGVHCHEKIIQAFVELAAQCKIPNIFVHAILDGRDAPPRSAPIFLRRLERVFERLQMGKLASLHGRFYAMDRDRNWDRTLQSFDVLMGKTKSKNEQNWQDVLRASYKKNIIDEFIKPILLQPDGFIHDGDGVIFANIRIDRSRQLPAFLLNQQDLPLHLTQNILPNNQSIPAKGKLPAYAFFMTAIEYHPHLYAEIIHKMPSIKPTFMDILERGNKTMFTIAESEKYAHVTYFFNGGRDIIRAGETRVIVPSRPDKNFADHPAMAAPKITAAVIDSLKKKPCDFYLINYANADMIGHTGNFEATIQAIQIVDAQLEQLYKVVVEQLKGTLYITADHGNAEDKFDENHHIKTEHTSNPVPFLVISNNNNRRRTVLELKELADIAPYILKQMFGL